MIGLSGRLSISISVIVLVGTKVEMGRVVGLKSHNSELLETELAEVTEAVRHVRDTAEET